MTSYEKIWDTAEDNHGVITSAQARRLGVKPAALVSMATNRKLVRIGQGVYKLSHHVPGPYDEYAQAVAMAGDTAFVRGASALMMRGLIPFDPARFYLGVSKRIRRKLPPSYQVEVILNPDVELLEGIPVERVASAMADARKCGAVDNDASPGGSCRTFQRSVFPCSGFASVDEASVSSRAETARCNWAKKP